MDRTSDFDLMKHNLTDVIEFTKIIIDYDGFNPTTDFWQPLVTTYFKLIDLPTDHDPHDGAIQSGGVPWRVEPVAKIMEALLSFLRIFGKPEGIDELLVFRAGSSKGFEAIEASGRVNDLSTHDHRGVLAIVTGVGNGHMPVHGGEGILVNLQKTSDISQDLTFLRVIEPLGVLDLLPSEFGDGHSVVDVILVIDRRIAGISAGGILIGVLLRNAREIDGIAQILDVNFFQPWGAVTEEVALFADGAVDWEEPQAARPVVKAIVAMTAEIRLKDLSYQTSFSFLSFLDFPL